MDSAAPPLSTRASTSRLWQTMQAIETCRHRAELVEEAASYATQERHRELTAIARQWRLCAAHVLLLYETAEAR